MEGEKMTENGGSLGSPLAGGSYTAGDVATAMLQIKSLDDGAVIEYSEWTHQWYVTAKVEISDGALLSGITEHERTPDLAVLAYIDRLRAVDYSDVDHVLVTRNPREHWRWNGAAFVRVPLPSKASPFTGEGSAKLGENSESPDGSSP
jgi:hypothetical protein